MGIIDIWINCPDEAVAEKVAADLIGRRLAACSNIYPPISSAYRWNGDIEQENEVPLLLKTRAALFDAVADAVRELHPYETPSIIGMEIAYVNEDYRDWVIAETEAAVAQ